jgi:Protein of unknown function (DUF1091)
MICNLTKIDTFVTNFTFGCKLTKTLNKINVKSTQSNLTCKIRIILLSVQVRLQNFNRVGKSDTYTAGQTDNTIDFCSIIEGVNNPFVNILLPNLLERLGDSVHPCPYKDSFLMKDVQVDGTKSVLFKQRQPYRLDLTASSGNNDLIIALSFYGTRKVV